MRHCVAYEEFICPKCSKKSFGAAVAVLDFLVCTDCFYNKYNTELEPVIKKMVLDYFQPERLSEKTPKGEAIV
jgi:hypothetical protein